MVGLHSRSLSLECSPKIIPGYMSTRDPDAGRRVSRHVDADTGDENSGWRICSGSNSNSRRWRTGLGKGWVDGDGERERESRSGQRQGQREEGNGEGLERDSHTDEERATGFKVLERVLSRLACVGRRARAFLCHRSPLPHLSVAQDARVAAAPREASAEQRDLKRRKHFTGQLTSGHGDEHPLAEVVDRATVGPVPAEEARQDASAPRVCPRANRQQATSTKSGPRPPPP